MIASLESTIYAFIITGLFALSGQMIGGTVFAWVAVVVLPVNAATNPVIYTLLAVWQNMVIIIIMFFI